MALHALALCAQVKRGASPKAIGIQLERAIQGEYHAKSFDKHDAKVADICLILGGPQLLGFMQVEFGLCSKGEVDLLIERPRFEVSPAVPTRKELKANYDNFHGRRPHPKRSMQTLMIDGVNGESRVRPRPTDAKLLGFGRQSDFSAVSTLEMSSHTQLDEAFRAYEAGKLKLLDEIDVICIAANSSQNYGVNLLLASGTTKLGETHQDIISTLELVVELVVSDEVFETQGPTSDFQSDGAAVIKLALHLVLTKFELPRDSEVRKALGVALDLFNYWCGGTVQRPIVQGVDGKHNVKRYRMAAKSLKGVRIKVTVFNRPLIRELLLETGTQLEAVNEMLVEGSAGAQNVPATMKLMLALSEFEKMPDEQFSLERRNAATFHAFRKELQILARYSRLYFEVIACQDADTKAHLSIGQVLRKAAQLSHIAFVLFRTNQTHFVPSQNYGNTQLMIRAFFHAVAFAKSQGITELFLFFVSDDRLENMFGMQRVLECGRNFDLLEFGQRASELMRLGNYKGELPDHFKTARRLGGTFFDHIAPRSFLHPAGVQEPQTMLVNPQLYDPSAMWIGGASDAKDLLTESSGEDDPPLFSNSAVDFKAIALRGADMLRPNGNGVYVGLKSAREEDPNDDRGEQCPSQRRHSFWAVALIDLPPA